MFKSRHCRPAAGAEQNVLRGSFRPPFSTVNCYGNATGLNWRRAAVSKSSYKMPENIAETDENNIDAEEKGEEEEEAIPDYVFPLFFTSKTQEIFGCRADEDVTTESPHIFIAKERILEDYKERAAISDFHPAKSIVQVFCCGVLILLKVMSCRREDLAYFSIIICFCYSLARLGLNFTPHSPVSECSITGKELPVKRNYFHLF